MKDLQRNKQNMVLQLLIIKNKRTIKEEKDIHKQKHLNTHENIKQREVGRLCIGLKKEDCFCMNF